MTELTDKILEIVDEHSGGCKMAELVIKIALHPAAESLSLESDEFHEQLEEVIRLIPELEILTYLSVGPPERIKQFIYRVLV